MGKTIIHTANSSTRTHEEPNIPNDCEEWMDCNHRHHREDGPASIVHLKPQNKYRYHWALKGKFYPFEVWAYKVRMNTDEREAMRKQYNELELNKYEKEFFSKKNITKFWSSLKAKKKKVEYTKILELLDSPNLLTDEIDEPISQIEDRVKQNGLEKHIQIQSLMRKKEGGGASWTAAGKYAIIIRDLEIVLRGYSSEEESIFDKKTDEGQELSNFQINFINNKIIGHKYRIGGGGFEDIRDVSLKLRASSIILENNTFYGTGLVLFTKSLKMIKNKIFRVKKNDFMQPVHIHYFYRRKVKSTSSNGTTTKYTYKEDENAYCDVDLYGNELGPLSIDCRGRINIYGKNTINFFMNIAIHFIGECYLGPKLYMKHNNLAIKVLESHKKVFSDLLNKAMDRNDKTQQKIIESELSRIEFHIHRHYNKKNLKEMPDLLARWLYYICKLELYDRHSWFIKMLLAISAAIIAINHFDIAINNIWSKLTMLF